MSLNDILNRRVSPDANRHAGWVELFFDLAFVALIAVAVHVPHDNPPPGTILVFVLLLFPPWWAWINLTATINLFGADSLRTQAFLIAAMPGIAMFAIAMPAALGDLGWLFALGGAWIRLILFVAWLLPIIIDGVQIGLWRPLSYGLATSLIWLASIAVPAEWRWGFWLASIVIEAVLLAIPSGMTSSFYGIIGVTHLVERLGLFLVIVVGESVYLIIVGLSNHPSVLGGVAGIASFLLIALLARAAFLYGLRTLEERLIIAQQKRRFRIIRDSTMYLPFFIIAALALASAAIGAAVREPETPLPQGEQTMLLVGVLGFYFTNAIASLQLGETISRIVRWLLPAIAIIVMCGWVSTNLPSWLHITVFAAGVVVVSLISLFRNRAGTR
ncbi:low temperature requirement protein A [Lysinibacter sp. HNR]|uniref:low temperature requirement protein A n=1 Tax=Lysinibacter sp. HNR TaxID=3031408 RepID=UPI0024350EDB|nr:low temperature requirement protein A [Lysinibacter sp. HNR]WGD37535.1 low temperature requirement protein A [Lysinibacter sp. HNR]